MEKTVQGIQSQIDLLPSKDRGELSDGCHTFNELYDHRIQLYIVMADFYSDYEYVWKSRAHSDGSVWKGWFILGIRTEPGKQITYHLPMDRWDDCWFAVVLDKAPEWDGHTSADVLERLKRL